MSPFDNDREYGYVGWIHTRYATGLGQVFRAVLFEFLATFKADGDAFIIVQPLRNADGLVLARTFGCQFLLFDVPFIAFTYVQLFLNFLRQIFRNWTSTKYRFRFTERNQIHVLSGFIKNFLWKNADTM